MPVIRRKPVIMSGQSQISSNPLTTSIPDRQKVSNNKQPISNQFKLIVHSPNKHQQPNDKNQSPDRQKACIVGSKTIAFSISLDLI
jgi:hypothetical protein